MSSAFLTAACKLMAARCSPFTRKAALELDTRLKTEGEEARKKFISLKSMEHIKRTLEGAVARESHQIGIRLDPPGHRRPGAPFIGLLGTVWGVMDTFAMVGQAGRADLATMAPGVSAALITTVAGFAGGDSLHVRL